MQKFFPILGNSALFDGISAEDLGAMLNCLGAILKTYDKDAIVYFEGDRVTDLGLLVGGRLHLVKNDVWGNSTIVTELTPPDMFAESAVCSGLETVPVSVIAKERSEILCLDYKRVVTTCSSSCSFHSKLIRNMISVLAWKNIMMSAKMEHMSKRTTKDKLLSYLSGEAGRRNSKSFEIPYNRQELADYLSVERSALSAEMSKLKSDGVIDYRKNHFELLRETLTNN
ncbi:MAG: Crp/Fnr family transcriptional regulator [Oscillospiraceae bacterium]|jgi:CRP-like cAMP-binding protein|nr:Crp/Fnr family transcriptional regulator [Oscillospiraceae bacterium]